MKLDVKFQQVVKENAYKIIDFACKTISENHCPYYEGVSCSECFKYTMKIMLEVDDHE